MKSNLIKIGAPVFFAVLFLFAGIYIYASPYLAISDMRQAVAKRDAETVSSYIDFPKFKENLKAELNAKIMVEMTKQDTAKNPFAGLGMMIAQNMINSVVDALATPAGIEQMMKNGGTANSQNAAQNAFNQGLGGSDAVEVTTGYKSFNEFAIDITNKSDATKGSTIIFERRGLAGWQLVNMKIKWNFPCVFNSLGVSQNAETRASASVSFVSLLLRPYSRAGFCNAWLPPKVRKFDLY